MSEIHLNTFLCQLLCTHCVMLPPVFKMPLLIEYFSLHTKPLSWKVMSWVDDKLVLPKFWFCGNSLKGSSLHYNTPNQTKQNKNKNLFLTRVLQMSIELSQRCNRRCIFLTPLSLTALKFKESNYKTGAVELSNQWNCSTLNKSPWSTVSSPNPRKSHFMEE